MRHWTVEANDRTVIIVVITVMILEMPSLHEGICDFGSTFVERNLYCSEYCQRESTAHLSPNFITDYCELNYM